MTDAENAPWQPLLSYWFGPSAASGDSFRNFDRWKSLGAMHVPDWQVDLEQEGEIRERFGGLMEEIQENGIDHWRKSPLGTLAYILVADLLPRCLHRGTALAYRTDHLALEAVVTAQEQGMLDALRPVEMAFAIMPFTHAEDRICQQKSVAMYQSLHNQALSGNENEARSAIESMFWDNFLNSARRHARIVQHFGRFPHRNRVLGRDSTPEEARYLADPWSFFKDDENAP